VALLFDDVPAAQASQLELPGLLAMRAAGHGTQNSPALVVPKPEFVERSRLTYDPARQVAQLLEPVLLEKVPTPHAAHWALDTAPVLEKNRPALHSLHCPRSHDWHSSRLWQAPKDPAPQLEVQS
jgi:hypothetical protein